MRVRMKHWPTLTVSMSGTSTPLRLSFKACQQTGRSCSAFLIKSRDTHNWPCWRKKINSERIIYIDFIDFPHSMFSSHVDQILILLIFWAIVIRLSQIIFFPHRHLAQFIIYVCYFCLYLFGKILQSYEAPGMYRVVRSFDINCF